VSLYRVLCYTKDLYSKFYYLNPWLYEWRSSNDKIESFHLPHNFLTCKYLPCFIVIIFNVLKHFYTYVILLYCLFYFVIMQKHLIKHFQVSRLYHINSFILCIEPRQSICPWSYGSWMLWVRILITARMVPIHLFRIITGIPSLFLNFRLPDHVILMKC